MERLKSLFAIDLRSLALFRVMLAIAMFAELAHLAPDLYAIFDDRGVYPRSSAMAASMAWSLYFINGHVVWAAILFALTALAAMMLLVGYRTRLASVLSWVLIVSLTTRIGAFTSGGEMEICVLLFWSMFLPLGARCSVDAALSNAPRPRPAYRSAATLAILLQVVSVYLFSALLKTGALWQAPYNAIYAVLNTPEITTPLARSIAGFPAVLSGVTAYVWWLEMLVIFALFSPFFTAFCRGIAVLLLLALHTGFALFLAIGIFPLIAMAGLTVFVPGAFWDRLLGALNARPHRRGIRLYYDEDCAFCRKTCRIFRELCLPPDARIEPAQATPEMHALMRRDDSWVVVDGVGICRTRWNAVAWVWRRSPLLWPLGAFFLLPFMHRLGDLLYGAIARHRGAFGRLSARLLREHAQPLAAPLSRPAQFLAVILAVMTLLWNIAGLPQKPLGVLPKPFYNVMHVLRLRQKMQFFAPSPRAQSQWPVIEGTRRDGTKLDLLWRRRAPASHDVPRHGYEAYPGYRWRKYFARAGVQEKNQAILGRYYCRVGAAMTGPGDAPMQAVELVFYKLKTALGEGPAPAKRIYYGFSYDCKGGRVRGIKDASTPAESPPAKQGREQDKDSMEGM